MPYILKAIVLSTALLSCISLQALAEKPNILWLTNEDTGSRWLGCYGNEYASTPNLDQLAADGFQYLHCFANAPVCAPSRSTWITGMLAISNGTFPMRSRNEIPHDKIKYYPDLLKKNGYYVGNDKKTDYNIGGRDDSDCWDNSKKVDWQALKQNQPFFQVINHGAHESSAFGEINNTKYDPRNVTLQAYHPDIPGIRNNYAKYHDAVAKMDAGIGATLRKLEQHGLAENTIVIYNSDHGEVAEQGMQDDSHEVRAMAAWLAINTGNEQHGLACLKKLIEQDSYALLTVLNIIDWMGPVGEQLIPAVEQLKQGKNLPKYIDRMTQYLSEKEF